MSNAPLVPGPLYGLRTWRVVTHDGRERLSAPQRGTPWNLGRGWIQATCGEGHAAPAAECLCGIHAWHPRRASARRVLRSRFDLPGIVEADGAVEVHEDGFRAERARPYAFVRLPGRNPFLIERLAAAYGAEILDLRRPEELLAVCRERRLGLQEPVVVELLGAEAIAQRRRTRARRRRNDALRVVGALLIVAVLLVMLTGCGGHGSPTATAPRPPGLAAAKARTLDAALTKAFKGSGSPGLAVAVVAPGWTWAGGRGVGDLHTNRRVSGDTPFGLASVTKTFVAALMLRLAEQGRLRLDDPLARWLPHFPGARRITLRELLNQTSGLPEPDAPWRAMLTHPRRPMPVATFLHAERPARRPGEFLYSNTNYLLAGQVIERATRTTVAKALHRELLDGRGLQALKLQPQERASRLAAHGHAYPRGTQLDVSDGSRYVPFTSIGTAAWTAGGLVGSARDVAGFGQALFAGHLLTPASLRQMLRFNEAADVWEGYGLGAARDSVAGQEVWGHEGQMPGFHTVLMHVAKAHVTIVVLANDELADVSNIAGKMIDAALAPPAAS